MYNTEFTIKKQISSNIIQSSSSFLPAPSVSAAGSFHHASSREFTRVHAKQCPPILCAEVYSQKLGHFQPKDEGKLVANGLFERNTCDTSVELQAEGDLSRVARPRFPQIISQMGSAARHRHGDCACSGQQTCYKIDRKQWFVENSGLCSMLYCPE